MEDESIKKLQKQIHLKKVTVIKNALKRLEQSKFKEDDQKSADFLFSVMKKLLAKHEKAD